MKRRDFKRIALCVLGGLILAAAIKNFAYAAGLLPAGFAGLTILIQDIFKAAAGISLPYGPVYLLINLPVIILAFIKIGKKFTAYSCLTIVIVSVFTDLIPVFDITDDVLLLSIFGGIVGGTGVSLCLLGDATSGGTDFISIFISEKTKKDSWNYILAFNAFILLCAGLMFGWDKALYSIIYQFASTEVIQYTYGRYKKNTLFIITNKGNEVAETISRLTSHGATEIEAKGMYNGKNRTIIYSVIDSDETRQVIKEIKEEDPEAFINSVRTDHLSGRYFMRPND